MTKRHDNMLEAFRESSRIEETKPAPQPRAGEALRFPGTTERVQSLPPARGAQPSAAKADAGAEVDGSDEGDVPASPPAAPRRKAGADEDLVGVTGVPNGAGAGAARPPAAPRERGTQITLPIGREWFFALASLALTVFFLLGRWSAGTVSAAEPGQGNGDGTSGAPGEEYAALLAPAPDSRSGGQAAGAVPAASQVPEAREQVALTAAGRAFLDPTNAFTIVAITYDDSEAGRELAISTYRHLEAEGFDVVYPRRKSGKLLLFVGASAGYRDLESVEAQLRRTRGPNGRLPFTGAYRVNISDYR